MPLKILTSVLVPLLCLSTQASGPTVDGMSCVRVGSLLNCEMNTNK